MYDKYTLLEKTHSQAMEIDPACNLWFFFSFSASSHPSWKETHMGVIYTKCHCSNPRPVPKHSPKTWTETSPGSTCVLGNRRGLMQATELWTSILVGILWRPRAHPVLMCAASWTATTQPGQQRIHCESKTCRLSTGVSLMNTQELHEQYDKEGNKLHFLVKPSNSDKIHYLYIVVEEILKLLDTA